MEDSRILENVAGAILISWTFQVSIAKRILELVQSAMFKCLTGGADKVFKDLAEWNENLANHRGYCNDQSSDDSDERESESKIKWNKVEHEKASEKPVFSMFESSKKAANSHSGSYNNGSALNFLAFLTKLSHQRVFHENVVENVEPCFCSSVTNSVPNQLTTRKSLIKLSMMMFGRAIFWSIYVCSVLFGLLVLGFVIGCFAMRHLVEEPIQAKETLNFDYTKTSPVVFVPISSSPGAAGGVVTIEEAGKPIAASARGTPYNHKLQLSR